MSLRRIFNGLPWLFLLLGMALLRSGYSLSSLWAKIPLFLLGFILAAFGLVFAAWYFRANHAQINPSLEIESWDVVNDGMHNSNSDMLHWGEFFYLVHAVSPYHFANTGCYLVLSRSPDGHHWETLTKFSAPGEDIRDPKLAVIADKLFLYALVNKSFDPEPYATVYAFSQDGGFNWSYLARMPHAGWLFWKPKSQDGKTWYAAAYWYEHGKSALFCTEDGIHWGLISMIHDAGLRNDETDIEFLPDGRCLCTARLEGDFHEWGYGMFFGDPTGGTLIASAEPPYTHFETLTKASLTRLDGPALFAWQGRVFGVGRFQPVLAEPFSRQGSVVARKRTSIFEVTRSGLVWISDVPSAGDTAYAGVALYDGCLYFSYYTSPIDRDYPWIVGMFNPTSIRLAKVDLSKLIPI